MNDDELDALLRQAAQPEAPAAATRDAVARARAQHRPRPHRRLLIGGAIVAGALALTAGTTLTAYYLRIPPFQGLPEGSLRTAGFIPLDYTSDEGIEVSCRVFLEFENVDSAGVARVDAAITATDWSTWGQDLYDGIANPIPQPAPAQNLNPQDDVMELYPVASYEFARDVIPNLGYLGATPNGPTLSGIATTCIPYGPGAKTSTPQP